MDDRTIPFTENEINLREYFNVLLDRKWLILSITLLFCTMSLIHSFMMKPVFKTSTSVLIQREEPRIVKIDEVAPTDYTGVEYYRTQYKLLSSYSLAERVNEALGGYEPWDAWRGRDTYRKKDDVGSISDEDRIRALLDNVNIEPIPNTQLLKIVVEDINPALAARIANLWAENYISYLLDAKFDATQYASGWLQDKIQEAKDRIKEAELKLNEYLKTSSIVIASNEDAMSIFDQLMKRKSDLEISLSEKLKYYKEKHPEIISIRSEIESVKEKIESEKSKELSSKDKEIQYNILKRDVATSRELYEALLKRVGETELTGGLKTTNIRIIDKASVPKDPFKPNKKKNLIMAFFLGIVIGAGLSFFIESLDQTVKTPEDVNNHLKIPLLASIPLPLEKDDKNIQIEFISSERPHSTISEAYRSLRTSIMFTAIEHKRKSILFTSCGPQEGKTTTAINMAIVMAQAGEKTLLIDADLRQPRIEHCFGVNKEHGLSEVLSGSEKCEAAILQTDIKNLEIITCGVIPPNPSELLGSAKMDNLLKELSEKYDRIIIDTPPVLAVTDAVVLSSKVDGAILVVRSGETNQNAAAKVKEIIQSVGGSKLLGCVLSMVETGKSGGSYYYYHYYGKYGKYGHKTNKETQPV